MKRIVSLVLALSMVLGLCATSFASVNLSDINDTKYEAAVEALIELNVVTGYPNGTYQPEKEVNRAELAKMIVYCMGLEEDAERAKGDEIFTDESLKADEAFAWARGYVNTAAAAGIIKGYPTGEFKPEKTVTYAEALTMMLRALGYGNVMEEEGTWPTNAILKARELELTDDVKYDSSSDGAARGNIAILLWNMLRTPMWKIMSENQGTGMTSHASTIMLNVKFPDYTYDDEATLVSFEVDEGKVTLNVTDEDEELDDVEGALTSGDLLRLVEGMKVSYLYNKETEEFLTLTAVDTLVEGRVDEDLEVNNKEYKNMEAEEGEYVVLLVDGKKVKAEVVLPEESYEIGTGSNTLKKVKKSIGEDALVIIDGEWLDASKLEEGDVVTTVTPDDNDANIGEENFYVVTRERVEGEFESFTYDEDAEEIRYYFEVDGKEYEAAEEVTVYEYNEDEEDYEDVTDAAFGEFDDEKGKYFGEEVELAIDYLGNVVNIYFDEVKDSTDTDYDFFVATGKYSWFESSKDGMVYYYDLANAEGEDTFKFTPELFGDLGLGDFTDASSFEYLNEYIEDGLEEELVARVFAATLNDDEALEYKDDKYAKNFSEMYEVDVREDDTEDDVLDDDKYFVGYENNKVGASTKVYTIKAIIDENEDGEDEVTGIEVEVTEGADALEGVEYAKFVVAVDGDGEEARVASYVFVGADAKSTDLNFGVVERFTSRAGIDYITISGEKYELDEDSAALELEIGNAVSFRVDDEVATIRDVMVTEDIDDEKAPMVSKVEDGVIYLSDDTILDTDRKQVKDDYKDTMFVLVTATLNDDDEVEFDADVEVLGEGIENASFKKGDRVLQGKVDENVIAIVRGLSDEDVFSAGALVEV